MKFLNFHEGMSTRSLIDEKRTNYNVDVIGSFSVTCLTVLKGIKPDTVIVMGITNMPHQSFYNVLNTKQMQWKNMTSVQIIEC